MNNKVSIIVPVYNIEKYIECCIKSILNQSYKNIEIILVDDGSSDRSGALCDAFTKIDDRVKVFHKNNTGVADTRNYGLKKATGDYISFIDGDDWIDSTYIETLIDAIEEYHCDCVAIGYKKVIDGTDMIYSMKLCDEPMTQNKTEVLNQACDKKIPWVGYSWGKLLSRKVIEDNQLMFDTDIKICEDSLFQYKFFNASTYTVKLPEVLYNYRIRRDSATGKANIDIKLNKTKVVAMERALLIAKIYCGSEFEKRVAFNLLLSVLQYLEIMSKLHDYNKKEIEKCRTKINIALQVIAVKSLPYGTKIKILLINYWPKLFFYLAKKKGFK